MQRHQVGTDEFAVPNGSLIDVEAEIEKQDESSSILECFLAGSTRNSPTRTLLPTHPKPCGTRRKKQSDSEERLQLEGVTGCIKTASKNEHP
jgi:valyl-tRNA synthetase